MRTTRESSLPALHGTGSGAHSSTRRGSGPPGKDGARGGGLHGFRKEPEEPEQKDDLEKADPQGNRRFHDFILKGIALRSQSGPQPFKILNIILLQ